MQPVTGLRRSLRTAGLVVGLGMVGGCAILPDSTPPPRPGPPPPTRSELVLLNVSESSGWVAYACDPRTAEDTEIYRIVVLRQSSGDIIYDSQVPLASNLCTHGFEMAPDDPRLRKLAVNVDRSIIAPLEATASRRDRDESPAPAPTPTPAPVIPAAEETDEPEPVATPAPRPRPPAETDEPEASVPPPEAPPAVRIDSVDGRDVTLVLREEGLVETDDRLFVRRPPTVIALPGYEEDAIVSEGEVAGLLRVTEVDGLRAAAEVLSGDVPENGVVDTAAESE